MKTKLTNEEMQVEHDLADIIVKSVNEHAALVAVAEAAEYNDENETTLCETPDSYFVIGGYFHKLAKAGGWDNAISAINSNGWWNITRRQFAIEVQKVALANLAAVREGKAVQS